jgi:hypothetical protein
MTPIPKNEELSWCNTCLARKPWKHDRDPAWKIRLRELWRLITFRWHIELDRW